MGNNDFMQLEEVDMIVLCHNCSIAEQNADISHMTMEQAGVYSAATAKWLEVNEGKFLTHVGTVHMGHGQCQFCRMDLSDLGFGVVMAAQEVRA